MIVQSRHSMQVGPFSSVRPGEVPQDRAESAPSEPVDEVVSVPSYPTKSPVHSGASSSGMMQQGRSAAGAALAAFPQIVHVLADPELHLGEQLSSATGLPVLSLEEKSVEEIAGVLASKEYAQGFILQGFPRNTNVAEGIDQLLSATSPNERRVLGWQDEKRQEIVDHYIDQGLLWNVPSESPLAPSDQVKSALLECLVGLPARK